MRKPCRLVLLKRRIANPDMMTAECREEYWAGRNAPGGEWVEIKSNAALLNKSDAKRDLLENPQFVENNQIYYCDVFHETEFELVDLVEKKTFGWIIKCNYPSDQLIGGYLTGIEYFGDVPKCHWGDPLSAVVFTTEQKKNNLELMQKYLPNEKFEAIELFTE